MSDCRTGAEKKGKIKAPRGAHLTRHLSLFGKNLQKGGDARGKRNSKFKHGAREVLNPCKLGRKRKSVKLSVSAGEK